MTAPGAIPAPLYRRAALGLAAGGAVLLLATADRSAGYVLASVAGYTAIACGALLALPRHAPHTRLGAGNRVTLVRAVLVGYVAGAVATATSLSYADLWLLGAVGTVAVLLDGVDGWMARRGAVASPFGALFDQELDAFFILLLSLLVWRIGHAGPWVLGIGLMRYGFLALGALPRFRQPLPQRRRRQAICVVQVVALLLCVPALLPALAREAAVLVALALLTFSFGADIAWLARRDEAANPTA